MAMSPPLVKRQINPGMVNQGQSKINFPPTAEKRIMAYFLDLILLKMPNIRLIQSTKWPQNHFPSLRLLFADSLLTKLFIYANSRESD